MSYIAELKAKRILIVGAGTTGKALSNYLKSINSNFEISNHNRKYLELFPVLIPIFAGAI